MTRELAGGGGVRTVLGSRDRSRTSHSHGHHARCPMAATLSLRLSTLVECFPLGHTPQEHPGPHLHLTCADARG
jgi:hypothetical protein